MFCQCCGKNPYHPATGGIHPNGKGGFVAWCGPCEREMVKFLVAQSSRTFKMPGGGRIYWDGTVARKSSGCL